MNEETRKMIEALAAKLGTTAEHLWAVLVRQAGIEVAVDLGWAIVWGIAALACIWWFRRCRAALKDDRDEIYAGGMALAAVLAGIDVILCLVFINSAFVEYANPEYWALMQILKGGQ